MVATVTAVVGWCLCLAVCHVRGSYIPEDMITTIKNLLNHYTISKTEEFNGDPVFPKYAPFENVQAEMIYMSAVLLTYDKLLNQMLEQLPTPSPTTNQKTGDQGATNDTGNLRTQLRYILKKVTDLRIQHYRKQEQLLKTIQPLGQVQFNNSVIHSKALGDFIKMYKKASSLPNMVERRRRRRQQQTQMTFQGR